MASYSQVRSITQGQQSENCLLQLHSSRWGRGFDEACFDSLPSYTRCRRFLVNSPLRRLSAYHILILRRYVPNPAPAVFRITKDNHNILQGVAKDGERLTTANAAILDNWCSQNAHRFWTSKDRPLAPRSQGGADVIIVDDPQLPGLVKIAKALDPTRPVIFRSHIQVREWYPVSKSRTNLYRSALI
jgi:hypothetical protein